MKKELKNIVMLVFVALMSARTIEAFKLLNIFSCIGGLFKRESAQGVFPLSPFQTKSTKAGYTVFFKEHCKKIDKGILCDSEYSFGNHASSHTKWMLQQVVFQLKHAPGFEITRKMLEAHGLSQADFTRELDKVTFRLHGMAYDELIATRRRGFLWSPQPQVLSCQQADVKIDNVYQDSLFFDESKSDNGSVERFQSHDRVACAI